MRGGAAEIKRSSAFETPSRGERSFAEQSEIVDDVGQVFRMARERRGAVRRCVETGRETARVGFGIVEGAQQCFGAFG